MKKIAAVIALSLCSAFSHANLVTNGSFDSDLSGWANPDGTATWSPQLVQLTEDIEPFGAFQQTILTVPAGLYDFTLSFLLRRDEAQPSSFFSALLDGVSVYDVSGEEMVGSCSTVDAFCDQVTVTGQGTGDALFGSTLRFEFGTNGNIWSLDNVVFEAVPAVVPEPATGLLALAALGMLGFSSRRRLLKSV